MHTCVRVSVTLCIRSRTVRVRILKFIIWNKHKKAGPYCFMHIGLDMSVRSCVRVSGTLSIQSRKARDKIFKFNMWNKHKNKRTRICFFPVRIVVTEFCPFLDLLRLL